MEREAEVAPGGRKINKETHSEGEGEGEVEKWPVRGKRTRESLK